MGPCSMSVFITCTVRVNKQHPVNIRFRRKSSVAHYKGTLGIVVLVLLQNKICVRVRLRVLEYKTNFIKTYLEVN